MRDLVDRLRTAAAVAGHVRATRELQRQAVGAVPGVSSEHWRAVIAATWPGKHRVTDLSGAEMTAILVVARDLGRACLSKDWQTLGERLVRGGAMAPV